MWEQWKGIAGTAHLSTGYYKKQSLGILPCEDNWSSCCIELLTLWDEGRSIFLVHSPSEENFSRYFYLKLHSLSSVLALLLVKLEFCFNLERFAIKQISKNVAVFRSISWHNIFFVSCFCNMAWELILHFLQVILKHDLYECL
ncbi:hypothetical protein SUGI_0245640 [Cryptomeria japonica]|nr:hypothetical protein SUGI_0245640 [Cryptomeria japonica]